MTFAEAGSGLRSFETLGTTVFVASAKIDKFLVATDR